MSYSKFQLSTFLGLLLLCLYAISNHVFAQDKLLTYQQVYKNAEPRLYGRLPSITGWLDDDHYLESRDDQLISILVKDGSSEVFIDYGALNKNLEEGFQLQRGTGNSDDFNFYFFLKKGNLFFYNRIEGTFKQLTSDESEDVNPALSPDGEQIAFTRNKDLFVVNTETGEEKRLTSDATESIYNGWSSWVYMEEILGRRTRNRAFWWSPDSKKLAFMRFDDTNVPVFPLYKADGVHGELELEYYPKPGDVNPDAKLGVADIATGSITWMEVVADNDQYVAWPFWTPDSEQLMFQWLNRGQDHLKIYLGNIESGKSEMIYEEKQEAWIEFFEDIQVLNDDKGFILRSDKEGWSHLYHMGMDGKLVSRITSGEWPVRSISRVLEKEKRIFFTGWEEKSTDSHLFSVDFDGKNLKKLTKETGYHFTRVSSKGSYFLDTHSNVTTPMHLDLYTVKGSKVRALGNTDIGVHQEFALGKTELFTIPSGDGFELPAVWVLPPDFDESRKYPVIFNIYSGPAAGTVRDMYRRNSDHFMAQNGIIVISVDHRASGHFGKKSTALMHRNLGKWEMHDLIAAVKWLRNLPFVDADHIGISGGSYGGYATSMALTYGADYFTHGIASSSVIDWRLYDSVYTERYMDTPEENPEGYENSSVLKYIDNYKGHLLIRHGTLDDNVHMQNTIQFVDAMTDKGKEFDFMLYPNERHSIRGPKRDHMIKSTITFWFENMLEEKDLDTEMDIQR